MKMKIGGGGLKGLQTSLGFLKYHQMLRSVSQSAIMTSEQRLVASTKTESVVSVEVDLSRGGWNVRRNVR